MILVDAIVRQQATGHLRADDPQQMARYVWSVMHGVAMLIIDGQLRGADPEAEVAYAIDRLNRGIVAVR